MNNDPVVMIAMLILTNERKLEFRSFKSTGTFTYWIRLVPFTNSIFFINCMLRLNSEKIIRATKRLK